MRTNVLYCNIDSQFVGLIYNARGHQLRFAQAIDDREGYNPKMSKVRNSIDVIAITVLGALTFGLQIPTLGFFQDDWNFVFYSSARGAQGLLEFLLGDGRPGATWVYMLGFALLGYKPALWQFFSLLLRVLTAINFWLILKSLWPGRRYGNLIAALLFLTYPFFTLQPLSVAYAPHLAAYFLYSLSILLMLKAIEKPEKYLLYTIPAVLATFLHLFTVEYFVGLELLRPLVIWFVLSGRENKERRETLRKLLTAWIPYVLILLFFVYWRIFVLTTFGARHNPLVDLFGSGQIIFSVASNMLADLVLILITSWFKLIDPELYVVGPIRNFYLLALTITVGLCFYFLSKPASREEDDQTRQREVFLAGALIVATGMMAAYAEGYIIHLKVVPWNSRFALPVLLGLGLLVSGFIEILITSKNIRHIFLAVLMGLLAGFHTQNTLNFKYAWEKQERLYQQLIWRAPSMQPGTAIVANEEILGYMGDYPTSFGINTIYESKQVNSIPYWFFALSENFNFSSSQIRSGAPLEVRRATATFHGTGKDAIFISYEPDNGQCLWILRPEDSEYKYLPEQIKKGAEVSNIENIQSQERERKLYNTIVKENKDTWCYFYQRADLARQMEDWEQVHALWNDAQSKGYRPGNGFEYIPFIEAYAHLEKWEDAFQLTKTANKATKGMYLILCPTWKRLTQETPTSQQKSAFAENANDFLECAP